MGVHLHAARSYASYTRISDVLDMPLLLEV